MSETDTARLHELLAAALQGLGENGEFSLTRLAGGRNNRVYRIDAGDRQFAAKHYFSHPGDSRSRLAAEYAFCEFACRNGIAAAPRPLVCLPADNLAVYEFLVGRRLAAGEIGKAQIEAAIDFWQQLNAARRRPEAQALPCASESCFTIEEHLQCVDRRIAAVQMIEAPTSDHAAAREFATAFLAPAWRPLRQAILEQASSQRIDWSKRLSADERCLSPSDFGFHNALLQSDGVLRFFDFEYAGWDDPAKAVCDFFCQPEVPTPMEHFEAFAAAAVDDMPGQAEHRARIDLLFPAYRMKWCCILLNDFLPAGRERRRFGGAPEAESLSRQLNKAQAAFQQLHANL